MTAVPGIDPSVAPSGTGCVECDANGGWWVHLRRCAQCGHIGCCDTSPSQHATAHARASGHPLIQSFEPGEEWFWNYDSDEMYQGGPDRPRPLIIPRPSQYPGRPAAFPPTGSLICTESPRWLRTGLDRDADAYDRTRPVLPPDAFDDLIRVAGRGGELSLPVPAGLQRRGLPGPARYPVRYPGARRGRKCRLPGSCPTASRGTRLTAPDGNVRRHCQGRPPPRRARRPLSP
jgi:hypothetical protein